MEIRHKKVSDLTPVEYRACYQANYGYIGYMQNELHFCRKYGDPGEVIMLWDGPDDTTRSLIGWVLLCPVRVEPYYASAHIRRVSKYTVNVWVKSKYRKQGYGKMLMDEVTKLDPRPHVLPHSEASANLFSGYRVACTLMDRRRWIKPKPRVAKV